MRKYEYAPLAVHLVLEVKMHLVPPHGQVDAASGMLPPAHCTTTSPLHQTALLLQYSLHQHTH